MKINKMKEFLTTIFIFCLSSLIACDVSEKDASIEKGLNHIDRFEFNEAISHFQLAIEEGDNSEEIYYYLGESIRLRLFYSRYKELTPGMITDLSQQSENAYNKSLEINPAFTSARRGLGRLYYYQRNYGKALKQYEFIELEGITDTAIYREIGDIYLKLGKKDKARMYFAKAGYNRTSNLGKEKQFTFSLINKMHVNSKPVEAKSTIIWEIVDPIIFAAKLGNTDNTKSRIQDIYFPALSLELHGNSNTNKLVDINHIDIKSIMERCNNVINVFGIKIVEIRDIEIVT